MVAAGAWVANCVGALNFRYFLGFVGSNIVMMWYGAILAVATMWGALKDAGMLDRPVHDGSGAFLASSVCIFVPLAVYENAPLLSATKC